MNWQMGSRLQSAATPRSGASVLVTSSACHFAAAAAAATLIAAPAAAQSQLSPEVAALIERLARVEAANANLAAQVAAMQADAPPPPPASANPRQRSKRNASASAAVGVSPAYGFAVLDHAENVNRRTIVQLEAKQAGELDNMVTLSGGVTAVANAHWSNRANKFGYLMRHPSGNNQRTKATQEIVIHSAQLALTATPTDAITVYAELLYDPEQSFGPGTITAIGRNTVSLRKGHVMWGNLDKSPIYVAAGKMDVPFGLQDTVSPFTNSTNWHVFAPLAFGGQIGYYDGNLSARAMLVGGGAQFRSANVPVDGTNIPSKLNNFAVDASYRLDLAEGVSAMIGGSYLHGTGNCQAYPVVHFNPCPQRNPAWAAYGKAHAGRLMVLGEFAKNIRPVPGSAVPASVNPALAIYEAVPFTSFTVGGRYNLPVSELPTNLSVEFSKYISGDTGSPWERQNQWVAGLSHRVVPSVDVFAEAIRTEGWVPFNFISGGNQPNGATWSERDANSNIIMLGVQAAF